MAGHVPKDALTIKDVTQAELKLSQVEKIKLINDEIKALQDYCNNLGLSKNDLSSSAKPLQDLLWSQKMKGRFRFLVYLAIIVAICSIAYKQPHIQKSCHFWARKAQISILSYWDWTKLYDNDCLVANPSFVNEGDAITEADCAVCKKYSVKKVRNITTKSLNKYFLTKDRPVVVVDVTKDWPANEKFSVQFIRELYNNNSALKDVKPCSFRSSDESIKSLDDVWVAIDQNEYADAVWENCEGPPTKALRAFHSRIEILPMSCEGSSTNWVLVSKGKNQDQPILFDEFRTTGILFTQITGKGEIELEPHEACGKICKKQKVTLNPGQTVIFTEKLWLLSYRPLSDTETTGILTTYHQNVFYN
ncbi:hypothetical protein TrispH2_002884 [Trichoplax sp. H2]|nr:hypothetical protein TrispH2_002884 [Trichoplax sp. H2]|eukprot:RDD44759.1 hypothetical protein TrispH2_002884 [Trichoplax sp. H2]